MQTIRKSQRYADAVECGWNVCSTHTHTHSYSCSFSVSCLKTSHTRICPSFRFSFWWHNIVSIECKTIARFDYFVYFLHTLSLIQSSFIKFRNAGTYRLHFNISNRSSALWMEAVKQKTFHNFRINFGLKHLILIIFMSISEYAINYHIKFANKLQNTNWFNVFPYQWHAQTRRHIQTRAHTHAYASVIHSSHNTMSAPTA